jgi:sugar phosphate isomerase/epimerase
MSFSPLPLSYCTNVHPGTTLEAVESGLDQFTVPLRDAVSGGGALAAGLWLAAPVIRELTGEEHPEAIPTFAKRMADRGLTCHTLNAFPFGDFHSSRVKEQVYVPDWTEPRRTEYTLGCARVLAALLPDGGDGSISTVPLGFKALVPGMGFLEGCFEQILRTAQGLAELERRTGRCIRLAIEPEPLCVLETTAETVEFFRLLLGRSEEWGLFDAVRRHIGVCYDVCHQSVEFEDVAASIAALARDEIRINKVHITNALQLRDPATNLAGREALARYAEPRYLHQTFGRRADESSTVSHIIDLTPEFALSPPEQWLAADLWRIHFHVPVDADSLGSLETTREDLKRALAAVRQLPYAPHLEVETYTWSVFPRDGAPVTQTPLVEGLAREIEATRRLLAASE